ncbi:hypothetical protein ACFQY5_06195 [Paeniroseomonas aquatica]
MVDLVITGDCVVTPHSIGPADVAIAGAGWWRWPRPAPSRSRPGRG